MPHQIMTQVGHVAVGIYPVADMFDGTVRSDVFNMKNYMGCEFHIIKGIGTTGTSTITVNACDDVVPSNRTAIPFRYRIQSSGDTWGAVTVATATGFTTTAGSNQVYEIIVDASELAKAGYGYVELTAIEVVNSPVAGCVMWIGHESNQPQNIPATVLT
jgi:hypothetical protein